MSEDNATQRWFDVISAFFANKKDAEEEKYIKEQIKKFESDSKKNDYYGSDDLKSYFDNKLKKIKHERSIDFQRRRITALFEIKNKSTNSTGVWKKLSQESYDKKVSEINKKFQPSIWLNQAAKAAASVSFATHVSKLTHSKIDSPSIYEQVSTTKNNYLTTSFLKEKAIDGAVSGNQFAPVFQFLELECNGKKLAAEMSDINNEVLQEFSEKDEYLAWNKGFSKALTSGNPASHLLSKQVYFPVGQQAQYHLLCNVKSSSMAQAIFEQLFSDDIKKSQKIFFDDKFSDDENRYFPRRGKIAITASNHSNASQLNGKRGGKLYLFSSAPPVWNSQPKPPVYQKTFFDSRLGHVVSKEDIDYLRDFLMRFEQIELSIKHPERKKWITKWVGSLIDDILFHASSIQNMTSGWTATEGIRLKTAHQLFLDPYREDQTFQAERKANNWQFEVCEDFARWLNWMLVGKEMKFSPQEEYTRMWVDLMETALREYDELVSLDVKTVRASA